MDQEQGVVLGARTQNMLAELSLIMRQYAHDTLWGKPVNGADLVEDLNGWLVRYDVTPQDLDRVYDVMHRSGANL